jgi:hypothetical protein
MSEMVRYGVLANPYTPGVIVDFYGNPIPGGGTGWPSFNGSGSGNLFAETLNTDTVGYTMIDRGAGGVNLGARGTGAISLTSEISSAGITILNKSATGSVTIEDQGAAGGVSIISSNADGGISLEDNGGAGITVASDGGAVVIEGASTSIALTGDLGFYGVTPVARQSLAAVTTVAQLVSFLRDLGLGS